MFSLARHTVAAAAPAPSASEPVDHVRDRLPACSSAGALQVPNACRGAAGAAAAKARGTQRAVADRN
eukprot:CAMPEP_0204038030 /NCGR_PEP_ID=MMETSP0360-20130528/85665_1 /ASSEMBLY_ACC=CAM_ASM_000342 /TAXON_ID=268821 /ORGANISM="Scrippsiella Hangoei, Strain SHTV-5" /LENGTH=66 /DNA_ID=CAMNT_0050983599 /DNA_START=20 /DNA_END=217 /DNA_ORIENTATION=+